MSVAIKVPSVGESITEGTIACWHKKTGDVVHEGEPLFDLETDKATTPIPAPVTGKLTIAAEEGKTVSMISLAAPKDAKKAYEKGMDALKKKKLEDAQKKTDIPDIELLVAQRQRLDIAMRVDPRFAG